MVKIEDNLGSGIKYGEFFILEYKLMDIIQLCSLWGSKMDLICLSVRLAAAGTFRTSSALLLNELLIS